MEKYAVGSYAWNREMERIDDEIEGKGRRNFDNLSLVANTSSVPEDFYDATENPTSLIEIDFSSLRSSEEGRKKNTSLLLGIEFKRIDDALYVMHLGRSISLIKKLRSSIPNSTEQVELRRRVLFAIGMSEIYKDRVISFESLPLGLVGIRGQKALNHVKNLGDQLEQQLSDNHVKERVALLAHPNYA